jgi:iron complex transport system ATP-binding protein
VVNRLGCSDLVLDYAGPLRALDGIDLGLAAGDLLGVIGPNGSGKSTLLKCLAGLLKPTSGGVRLGQRDLDSLSVRERAREIAVVPQFLAELHDIRVADFVMGGRYAHFGRWSGPETADFEAVRGALVAADTGDLDQRLMSELSGGQRQRVLLARAIAQAADVLLVDEPTSSLDPEHQIQTFELIARSVTGSEGRAAVVVTHDLNLASQFATRLALLDAGRVVAEGDVESVLVREVLEPVYGPNLRYGTFETPDGRERPFVVPWRTTS